MELIKLQKSVHGKSAMASYKSRNISMTVYLYNNEFCKSDWGATKIVCNIAYTKELAKSLDLEKTNERMEFSEYKDFIGLRSNLTAINEAYLR